MQRQPGTKYNGQSETKCIDNLAPNIMDNKGLNAYRHPGTSYNGQTGRKYIYNTAPNVWTHRTKCTDRTNCTDKIKYLHNLALNVIDKQGQNA